MTPLQPNSSEWAIGVVCGWGIVVMSLAVIGSYAFAPPPEKKKEDRVVIHAAAPRAPETLPDLPPPPPGGPAPEQPKTQPKEKPQPLQQQPTKQHPRQHNPKAPAYPEPVPVPMPPSDPAPAEPGGEAGGVPGGVPGGEPGGTGMSDEAKAAIAAYKRRLANFFRDPYRVRGTGLDSDELAKRKVKVVVHVDAELTIVDYQVKSSGFPEFDAAAEQALAQVKGKKLPPPPPEYPGTVGPTLNINLICRPGQCD